MFRAISLMSMAIVFLMISPSLRSSLLGGYKQAGITMDAHSPFSYMALGFAVLGLLILFLYKSAQPRRQ